MTLGQKIKAARLEKGLTQKEVVGDYITRNMLSKIENDSATPSVRTLEYLAKALDLPTGYFLSDAQISDGLVPDGLNEARAAFREKRWTDCLALLEADKTAGTSDEGCLLHARAGAQAAQQALEEGRLAEARELAETAHYYNQEGLYGSPDLAARLAVLLGRILTRQGSQDLQARREELARTLEELDKLGDEL
ncbi:MAG: helix-turn-helix domain-containing protein [Oscillospiraceae bacterium]